MKRELKDQAIAELTELLKNNKVLYIADTSNLNAEATSKLRRECFKRKVGMKVVKNTLLKKAMERVDGVDYSGLFTTLHGTTAVLTAEAGNVPAKLIKEFRKTSNMPVLKGAYVEESVYIGDNQVDVLCNIKSKNELIGDVIALLQSPAKNVIGALQSGKHKLAGIVKTLENRATN
ncbi:MAG: 50S ribosomal protein L10 [Bacteroidota bacterium]